VLWLVVVGSYAVGVARRANTAMGDPAGVAVDRSSREVAG
jgi:hypothetical protein